MKETQGPRVVSHADNDQTEEHILNYVGLSPDRNPGSVSTIDFWASRNMRNTFLLLIRYETNDNFVMAA